MNNVPTVYVIDDNDDHREILFELISHAGYNVLTYSSGIDFLDVRQWDNLGCIILDNQMPQISGLQVQTELTKRDCDLPIIFVSGGSGISDAVHAVKEGAIGFMEKPVQSSELIEWIEKAIAQCKVQQKSRARRQAFKTCLASLTPREKQVYDFVIRGRTNKMIASELTIKITTVEFHRANMMEKMVVTTFSDLMNFCLAFRGPGNEEN